jgi:hypothetical protein
VCVADVYACLWESCGFESADSNEIVRHVNFHSYHTKIKCIGSNILARSRLPVSDKLPACTCLICYCCYRGDLHPIVCMCVYN